MSAGLTAVVLAAAAASAAAEKKAGLPQLNPNDFAPQLIWLVITFGTLYILLSKVVLPRIGSVIDERSARIQRDLDEAARLKRETEKALANYEQALADARGRAGGIASDTRAKLNAEVDGQRARVEAEIATRVADAEARIVAMKSQAMAQVGTIAADTASSIVTQLTGTAPSGDEISRAMWPQARE